MKKFKKLIPFLLVNLLMFSGLGMMILLAGCSPKESITPAWEPEKIDKQLVGKPLQLNLEIEPFDVQKFGSDFDKIQGMGPIFAMLAAAFANVTLEEEGSQDFDVEPIIYEATELDKIKDWTYFSKINVNEIQLKVKNAENMDFASLDFIKTLKVYLDFIVPDKGQLHRQGSGVLVANYNRDEKIGDLACDRKCINFKINTLPWKNLIKVKRTFVLYTELTVDGVPMTNIQIGGHLGASFELKTGY